MSQKGTRKSQATAVSEDKEKGTDSPVRDMKKKMAANLHLQPLVSLSLQKEKQIADKSDKNAEKSTDKSEKVNNKAQADKDKSVQKNVDSKNVATPDKSKGDKNAQKTDKGVEKDKTPQKADKKADKCENNAQKVDNSAEKPEKNVQKVDKSAEKPEKSLQKVDKSTDKPEKNVQKADKSADKLDKNAEKPDKSAEKAEKKTDKSAEKKTDKPTDNKNDKADMNKEAKDVSGKDSQPSRQNGKQNGAAASGSESSSDELTIDEQDEMFPELAYEDGSEPDFEVEAGRSLTRRSQVKPTKTPETPRPLSLKEDDPKDSKVLKMNDSVASDRKLRSSDSPKPEAKKDEKKKDSKEDSAIDVTEDDKAESGDGKGKRKLEVEVGEEGSEAGEPRIGVRTRARVSPYSRARPDAHDVTASSLAANYTGNNTTMEMDISQSSEAESPYLRGLRGIRGRSSYKQLAELALKHTLDASRGSGNTSLSEWSRPTGTVVGRKRKPEDDVELAQEAAEPATPEPSTAPGKRMRLFDGLSVPFRGFNTHTPSEIVGINTDLPLSAPLAAYDPERLKAPRVPLAPAPRPAQDRDGKRCVVM